MRPQKITFGDMREMGVRGVLVYCADYRCSHSVAISADRWADEVRLSDLRAQVRLQGLRATRCRCQAGLAERGVAIPGPGDYVRVWRSREPECSGKLSYPDTLSTELAGSTTPAAVTLFAACRLRRRWLGLGGWYNEVTDTRLRALDCACWI